MTPPLKPLDATPMGHGPYSMEGSARWRARAHGSSDEPLRGRLRALALQPNRTRRASGIACNALARWASRGRPAEIGAANIAISWLKAQSSRLKAQGSRRVTALLRLRDSLDGGVHQRASESNGSSYEAQERCFGRRAHDARFKAERQSKPRRKDARSRRRPQRHPGEDRVGNAQAMG